MTDLPPDIEQQLAGLSDGEWSALTARVRAPDSTEALRTAAAQILPEDAANAFAAAADVSKFTDGTGGIDQAKVSNYLKTAFGASQATGGQRAAWGQSSGGQAPGLRPGDHGRAAAAKRFGHELDAETGAATAGVRRGGTGRAEAQRRFGKKES
jgi:hypothetical protein